MSERAGRARARPLGTSRWAALHIELERLGEGPLPESPTIAVKVWDTAPAELRDFRASIVAAGGVVHAVGASAALILVPFGIAPQTLPPPLSSAVAAAQRPRGERRTPIRFGDRTLTFDRTRVMAIINLTDDSFSGDGVGKNIDEAVRRAAITVAEGADIVDVGGESARADVPIREVDEEIARVVPAVERISREVDAVVSIDTWKPEVAEAAVRAGATLINDIGGLVLGPDMADVAARHGVALVLNHTWMRPKVRPPAPPRYDDVVDAVYAFLEDRIAEAVARGVDAGRIIIDPGVAFGKSHDEDLDVMRRLGELRPLGRPILLAHSRKHVIGSALGGLPPDERVEGTAAAAALAVAAGVDIVRVHDVRAVARAVRTADAIVRAAPGDFAPTNESWPSPGRA